MARRKNQAAARESLLTAALTAVRDAGPEALQIKEVARIAEVSPATVHYYFDDRAALLRSVHAVASDRFFSARMELAVAINDAREKLRALIESGLPADDSDTTVTALYRLGAYGAGDHAHGELLGALLDKQVALYVGVLEVGVAQGYFTLISDPITIARHLVALEDAYGLHIASGNRALPRSAAIDSLTAYTRLATGCEIRSSTTGTVTI